MPLLRRHRATATQHIEHRDTRTDRTQRGGITSMVSATSRKEGYDAHCTVSVVTSFRVVVRTQEPNTHAHQHRSSSVDTLPSSSTVIHFVLFCHGSQITTFTNISKRWCIAWTHVRLAHGIAEAQSQHANCHCNARHSMRCELCVQIVTATHASVCAANCVAQLVVGTDTRHLARCAI